MKVQIEVSSRKKALRKGERATLRVTIAGLRGLRRATTLRVENRSPGTIRLKGGDSQRIRILPAHVSSRGTVTKELVVTGLRAGPFAVGAWLGRLLFAHLDVVTEAWGEHTEDETTKWMGDAHDMKATKEWGANSHGYDESKRWKGHGHSTAATLGEKRENGHEFDPSRRWDGRLHSIEDTKDQESNGHSFDATEKKGWYAHSHVDSKRWDEHNHDYDESRRWGGDGHWFERTLSQGWSPENPYNHGYEDTRTWDGDGHTYTLSKRWKDKDHQHAYEDSKKDKAGGREQWEKDNHDAGLSKAWWDKDHDYEASREESKKWDRDHHEWYDKSEEWREKGHDYEASKRESKQKK